MICQKFASISCENACTEHELVDLTFCDQSVNKLARSVKMDQRSCRWMFGFRIDCFLALGFWACKSVTTAGGRAERTDGKAYH